jgi:hypothetical protein
VAQGVGPEFKPQHHKKKKNQPPSHPPERRPDRGSVSRLIQSVSHSTQSQWSRRLPMGHPTGEPGPLGPGGASHQATRLQPCPVHSSPCRRPRAQTSVGQGCLWDAPSCSPRTFQEAPTTRPGTGAADPEIKLRLPGLTPLEKGALLGGA